MRCLILCPLDAMDTFHAVWRLSIQLHWETCLFSDSRLRQNSLTHLTSWSMASPSFPSPIGPSWDRIEITMSRRLSGQKAHSHAFNLISRISSSFLFSTSYHDHGSPQGSIAVKINVESTEEISTDYHRKREKRGHIDLEAARGRKQRFLLPAWSLSDLPAHSFPPFTVTRTESGCDPEGDLSGGNKMRGAIISPLPLLLFLPDNQSVGAVAWALHPANVPPCQYLW